MNSIEKFSGDYRFLSNFYPSIFSVNEVEYQTVEHFFQANKTKDPDEFEKIRKALTPGEAKRLGQKVTLRNYWEDIKILVMVRALDEKFKIPELREKLLKTGDAHLVEGNHWNDTYWGVCNGEGKNMLGVLLVELRESIRKEGVENGNRALWWKGCW